MDIDLYKLISKSDLVRISIKKEFRDHVKNKLKNKFETLKQASIELRINFVTFQNWWLGRRGPLLKDWLNLCKELDISEDDCFKNIESFYSNNWRYSIMFPRFREIDEELLAEGVGLYIAEGITSKNSNEISLSNTDFGVLKFYIKWLGHCFDIDKNKLNIYVYSHDENFNKNDLIEKWLKKLKVSRINNVYYYKKSTKECGLIVCSRSILRYLLNELIVEAKILIKKDKKLAHAYLRGILAGEGHVYIDKNRPIRYVEFGLKNKKEIEFIIDLLNMLGIKFSEIEKPNFTNIVICWKKNLEKLINNGGFGSNGERTLKLIKAYNSYKK